MFEHLGTRDVAVLVDMTDDYNRDIAALRGAHEHRSRFAHLRDTARRGAEVTYDHSLYGVDDNEPGLVDIYILAYSLNIGLAHESEGRARAPEPVRAELYLIDRLLARDIENIEILADILAYLKKNRRFAYAGVAAQEHQRTFDYSAAEDAVELGESRLIAYLLIGGYLAESICLDAARARAALGRRDGGRFYLLVHGVPLAAARAAAEPFRAFIAAFRTDIDRFCLACHFMLPPSVFRLVLNSLLYRT